MTLTVLQQQMRHADTKTALRIYAHAIPSNAAGSDGKAQGNWNKCSNCDVFK